ncbi:MAG TPA: DegT/DnrJ/EryC1/StrS family aminotransferase [Nocardioides sp.]
MSARIPLVDLGWQHRQIRGLLTPQLDAAMTAAQFVGGPALAAFEEAFASSCGAAYCVGVANGTDAIELTLRAAGIGPGDAVVLPANTFIASVEGITATGATPVFVDCDATLLMDTDAAIAALSQGARAVLPVHLYGQATDTAALSAAASEADAVVVEDAAQSQGVRIGSRSIGAHALAATTSFYPGKNLGAYGDGGAVVTDDHDLADRVRLIANHGSRTRYVHEVLGRNSRLDAIQALVLLLKLDRLSEWNDLRRVAARRYDALLAGLPVVIPPRAKSRDHVWHLYVVRVPERDRVLQALSRDGVEAAVHYPTPAHLHEATRSLGYGVGDFPRAERAAGEILSLPLYPGITEEQQERVVISLASALH